MAVGDAHIGPAAAPPLSPLPAVRVDVAQCRFLQGNPLLANDNTYLTALVATSAAVPVVAAMVTVASYIAPFPATWHEWIAVPLGAIITLVAWLLSALPCRRFAFAVYANRCSYSSLFNHLRDLQSRLYTLDDKRRKDPENPLVRSDAYSIAFTAIATWCEDIERELKCRGLCWLLATGYINMWRGLHHAEEAMIEIEPAEAVLNKAIHDELCLQGSNMNNSEELLDKLRIAVKRLRATKAISRVARRHDEASLAVRRFRMPVVVSARWRSGAEIAAVADDLPVTIVVLLESELQLVRLRELAARDVVAIDLRVVLHSRAVGNLGVACYLPEACIVALGRARKLVLGGCDGNVRAKIVVCLLVVTGRELLQKIRAGGSCPGCGVAGRDEIECGITDAAGQRDTDHKEAAQDGQAPPPVDWPWLSTLRTRHTGGRWGMLDINSGHPRRALWHCATFSRSVGWSESRGIRAIRLVLIALWSRHTVHSSSSHLYLVAALAIDTCLYSYISSRITPARWACTRSSWSCACFACARVVRFLPMTSSV